LTKPIDIGSLLEAGRSSRYLKFPVALIRARRRLPHAGKINRVQFALHGSRIGSEPYEIFLVFGFHGLFLFALIAFSELSPPSRKRPANCPADNGRVPMKVAVPVPGSKQANDGGERPKLGGS
jgi:hypothetical protein